MNPNVRHLRREEVPAPQGGEGGGSPQRRRTEEFRTFIFLTVIMAPVLAVMTVGGYGFIVWMYQLLSGPPGPGLH